MAVVELDSCLGQQACQWLSLAESVVGKDCYPLDQQLCLLCFGAQLHLQVVFAAECDWIVRPSCILAVHAPEPLPGTPYSTRALAVK